MALTISTLLFFIPFESHSDSSDNRQMPEYKQANSNNIYFNSGLNFVYANMQYQIRDISGGLICTVQSDNITIYDAKITFDYLYNHPSRSTIENNNSSMNYVLLKESWNVGEGDTFLSAVRNMIIDPATEKPTSIFFASTNGCAIQPGDKVNVYWEIVFG